MEKRLKEDFYINLYLKSMGFRFDGDQLVRTDDSFNSFLYAFSIKKVLGDKDFWKYLVELNVDYYKKVADGLTDVELTGQGEDARELVGDLNATMFEKQKYYRAGVDAQKKAVFEIIDDNLDNLSCLFAGELRLDDFSLILTDYFEEKIKNGEITPEIIKDIIIKNDLNNHKLQKAMGHGTRHIISGNNIFLNIDKAIQRTQNPELTKAFYEGLNEILIKSIEKANNIQNIEEAKKGITTITTRYSKNSIKSETMRVFMDEVIYDKSFRSGTSILRNNDLLLNGLPQDIANNINIKNLKQLIDLGYNYYGTSLEENPFLRTTITSLYVAFGYQNVVNIFNNCYGQIPMTALEGLFSSINLNEYSIPTKNGETKLTKSQDALKTFLFANNPSDPNANFGKLFIDEIDVRKAPIFRIISRWDKFYELCGGHVTLNGALAIIEKEESAPIGMKECDATIKLAGPEYAVDILNTYSNMQMRYKSSIPKVSGTKGKYEYEIMDLKDPKQMDVGYITRCCFTFQGAASKSLNKACSSENDRIFVIKENGKIVAQSWIWRRGNLVCFDNIEVYGVVKEIDKKIWNLYQEAAQKIIEISKENEIDANRIRIATVGKGYSKIKLPGEELESHETIYPTDVYTDANEQVALYKDPKYEQIFTYNVEPIYKDERRKINRYQVGSKDNSVSYDQINNIVNKINLLENNPHKQAKDPIEVNNDYSYITAGDDWFIGIKKSGELEVKSFGEDARKNREIVSELTKLKDIYKTMNFDKYIEKYSYNEELDSSSLSL